MLFRYVVSGFSGIGANLIVFSFVVGDTKLSLLSASVFGFIAAYIVTFLMHKYWTFKNLSRELFYKQSVVYFFSAIITLLINTSILYFLVTFFSLQPIFAQFVSLLFAAVLSLFFTTLVTFNTNASRIEGITSFFSFGLYAFLEQQKKWILALLFIMCLCAATRLLFLPLTFTTDSESYVATAQLLEGDTNAVIYGERILKPLAPAVMVAISTVGVSLETALLIQAIFFYFVLGMMVFWFGYEFFSKSGHAFLLSLIVVTSYPIVRYGVNYYTETGIWAIYFALLAAIMRWVRKPSFVMLVFISMLLLAGLLWKEYAVLPGLMFGIAILFHTKLSWTEKICALLQTAFLVLIPWGLWQYSVYMHYDYSYLNWFAIGAAPGAYTSEYSLFNISKTFAALLLCVWPLVFVGLYRFQTLTRESKKMLAIMLLPSFGFLLWGFVSSRLFFSLVPLIAPFVVLGFMALPTARIKIVVILLVVVVNSILTTLLFDPAIRLLLNSYS